MKHQETKSESLGDILRDLAKAVKPSARKLTARDIDKMIQDVRREAMARKANGSPSRSS